MGVLKDKDIIKRFIKHQKASLGTLFLVYCFIVQTVKRIQENQRNIQNRFVPFSFRVKYDSFSL